jgi:hypothetical protein
LAFLVPGKRGTPGSAHLLLTPIPKSSRKVEMAYTPSQIATLRFPLVSAGLAQETLDEDLF